MVDFFGISFHVYDLFLYKAQELYQLIEGQNTTLCKLREMAHRNQLTQSKVRLDVHKFTFRQVRSLNHSLPLVINLVSRSMT